MPTWALIATIGALTWVTLAWLVTRAMSLVGGEAAAEESDTARVPTIERRSSPIETPAVPTSFPGLFAEEPIRVLIVDDDPNFRELVTTTFETAHLAVEEADGAAAAAQRIAARHPDVIVLDVGMPGVDGVTFCQGLRSDPHTRDIPVVLLTGDAEAELSGWQAGADAFLRKPFSPLELLNVVERFAMTRTGGAGQAAAAAPDQSEQLLLYAQDFRHMLEIERGQRRLLQTAYRETVVALAQALEAKDGGTSAHSERVRRYATELASVVEPTLLREPGVEYGFILHDVGKIAIPDAVLRKTDTLTPSERRLLETHPILGEQMVGNAALLRGHGAEVVRSHHERWDGSGYPDGLVGGQIPLAARIFALADALDAMTSDRPYRSAGDWTDAVDEIRAEAGSQFDPRVVSAFDEHEEMMRRVYYEVSTN
jgi:response regulator RpfG family c-di-GMP phosphodiesterase